MDLKFYLTSGEAANYLTQQIKQKVTYYDLDNLLRAEAIKPPEKIGGRRLWSTEDLKRAVKALRIRRAKRPVLSEKRSTLDRGNNDA